MPTLRLRPDFEAALRQVQGVKAASVVTGPDAFPTEIHVLAETGKAPKQVVRDVQSLAMAQFDLDIDHRIVSVVQLDDDDYAPTTPRRDDDVATAGVAAPLDLDVAVDVRDLPADEVERPDPVFEPVGLSVVPDSGGRHAQTSVGGGQATARVVVMPDTSTAQQDASEPAMPLRPTISAIMLRTSGQESEATVELAAGGTVFEGQVVGPAGPSHRARLVAQATLNALEPLLGHAAEIETAVVAAAGARSVAMVVLVVMAPRLGEQVVTGSALVRGDEADAVARAVLDALNRRLAG